MDTNFVNAFTDIFFRECGPTVSVEWIKFLWDKKLLELVSTLNYDKSIIIALLFKGKNKIQVHLLLNVDILHIEFTDVDSRHEIKAKADIEGFFEFVQKTFEVKDEE